MTPVYPAVFRRDEDYGGYEVLFPDIPGRTCGKTLEEAFLMACDLLDCFMKVRFPTSDWPIPEPTSFFDVKAEKGDIVLLVRPAVYEREEEGEDPS